MTAYFSSLLLAFLWQANAPVVLGQLFCNTSQSISSPFTSSPEDIPPITRADVDQLCASGLSFSASKLDGGLWYSYIPSRDGITYMALDPVYAMLFSGSCDALTCQLSSTLDLNFGGTLIAIDAGIEYFLFVFHQGYVEWANFTLDVEEIQAPVNDGIENAVALTPQDLPFSGVFTTYGATSDYKLDACGLDGKAYGVWFSYYSTVAGKLSLQEDPGNFFNNIAVMALQGNTLFCVTRGGTAYTAMEWTTAPDTMYYILVTEELLINENKFTLTIKSVGSSQIMSSLEPSPAQVPTKPICIASGDACASSGSRCCASNFRCRGKTNQTLKCLACAKNHMSCTKTKDCCNGGKTLKCFQNICVKCSVKGEKCQSKSKCCSNKCKKGVCK